jgi:hypothetical protein
MFAVDGTLAPASGPSTSGDPLVSFFGGGAGCAHKRAGQQRPAVSTRAFLFAKAPGDAGASAARHASSGTVARSGASKRGRF